MTQVKTILDFIREFSDSEGVPMWKLKLAAGIPLEGEPPVIPSLEGAPEPYLETEEGSDAEGLYYQAWDKLGQETVQNATTVDELNKLVEWDVLPEDSESRLLLGKRAIELATNASEAKLAHAHVYAYEDLHRPALRKWIELCTTIEEVINVHDEAEDHEDQSLAIKKWASLCTTFDEALEALECAPDNRSEANEVVVKRAVELCTTVEQARLLCDKIYHINPSSGIAFKKLVSFYA